MDFLKKLGTVLSHNMWYTIILVVALLLFAIYSDGLVYGLITAASALVAYICIDLLCKEYHKLPEKKVAKKKQLKK